MDTRGRAKVAWPPFATRVAGELSGDERRSGSRLEKRRERVLPLGKQLVSIGGSARATMWKR